MNYEMKSVRVISIVFVSIIAIALLATVFDFNNTKAFEYIVTFLSIGTGFNITALSIIANSQFTARLQLIQDKTGSIMPIRRILVNTFKFTIAIFLVTICAILYYYFIDGDNQQSHPTLFSVCGLSFTFPRILKAVVWYLTIVSLLEFRKLLAAFAKIAMMSVPKE